MPRITKVYTRTGDDGQTGLGTGARISKTAARIAAYGTVDELNAAVGLVLSADPPAEIAGPLRRIQNELFHVGSDLCVPEADKAAMPVPTIEPRHITALEALMDTVGQHLPALENFILPGGCETAARLHVARTVCRRAERDVLQLAAAERVGGSVVPYLNRLSDALFVLARRANQLAGVVEPTWESRS